MYEQVEKPKENKSRAVANSVTQKKSNVNQSFGFVDNRPEAIVQRKVQELADDYSSQQRAVQNEENKNTIQRVLIDYSATIFDSTKLVELKKSFPGQTTAIDTHHSSSNYYIVNTNSGALEFIPSQDIPDKRDHSRLERHPFTGATQAAVPVASGQHRRHIISNHLMKLAIDKWQAAHPSEMTKPAAQALLDDLNNYIPNLIPGPGVPNSAIGMLTNRATGVLRGAAMVKPMPPQHFAANVAATMGQPTGFQQQAQSELVDPVLAAFGEEQTAQFPGRTMSLLRGIRDSTDFDWPEGANASLYEDWIAVYNNFNSVKDNPDGWTKEYFNELIARFKSLKKPTP